MKIRSVVTNRQIDRQTNAGHYITFFIAASDRAVPLCTELVINYLSELCRSNAEDAARSRLRLPAHGDLHVRRPTLVIARLHCSRRASVVEQTTSDNPVI